MDHLEDRMVTATPEGVSVEVVLAGLGSRFGAIMLDTLLQLALLFLMALAIGVVGSTTSSGLLAGGVGAILVLLDFFGYFIILECLTGGRTVGKLSAGLRTVRVDGRHLGFRRSVVRNVLRIIDYLTLGLFILGTSRNQRLGDLAAGTIVVRERRVSSVRAPSAVSSTWAPSAPEAPPVAVPPVFSAFAEPLDARGWDVTAVTNDQLVLAERFLRSRFGYTATARARLAANLAGVLAACVAGAPDGLEAERFVEGVVAAKTGAGWAVPGWSTWGRAPRRGA